MTRHEMRLLGEPFLKIKNGGKKIELRLYDEKRRKMEVGDDILYINRETGETLSREITGLCRFKNFKALVAALSAEECGWSAEAVAAGEGGGFDADADMEEYYSKEDIEKYGALGIILGTKS